MSVISKISNKSFVREQRKAKLLKMELETKEKDVTQKQK